MIEVITINRLSVTANLLSDVFHLSYFTYCHVFATLHVANPARPATLPVNNIISTL